MQEQVQDVLINRFEIGDQVRTADFRGLNHAFAANTPCSLELPSKEIMEEMKYHKFPHILRHGTINLNAFLLRNLS